MFFGRKMKVIHPTQNETNFKKFLVLPPIRFLQTSHQIVTFPDRLEYSPSSLGDLQ
jgi:hypothetical protein